MHRAPHIVQVQLGECMKNIVLVDFPEKWPSLLPQLTQNLQSQVFLHSPLHTIVYIVLLLLLCTAFSFYPHMFHCMQSLPFVVLI